MYGRIIRRDGAAVTLHRNRKEESNTAGLHSIFILFIEPELVPTDEEDNVLTTNIVAIIFVLTVAKILSFNYSV
jgi:hypothetical protein